MRWPFAWIGKPFRTICEQRIHAWGGMPVGYRYTFPEPNRWKLRIRRQPLRRKSA